MSDENQAPETVPLEKYNRAQEELRKARERVRELEPAAARVAELEPLTVRVAEYETKIATLTTEHTSAVARLTEDLAMAEVGLTDPLGRDTARVVYQRLPEKDRPAIGDYLRSLNADGADIPKPLQPYFTRQPATDTTATIQRPKEPPPKNADPPATMGGDGVSLHKILTDAQKEFARTRNPQVLIDADKRYQEAVRAKAGRP